MKLSPNGANRDVAIPVAGARPARKSYARTPTVLELPRLTEVQLRSRWSFETWARAKLDEINHSPDDSITALVFLDIDNFKHINDTYAHRSLPISNEFLLHRLMSLHRHRNLEYAHVRKALLMGQQSTSLAPTVRHPRYHRLSYHRALGQSSLHSPACIASHQWCTSNQQKPRLVSRLHHYLHPLPCICTERE